MIFCGEVASGEAGAGGARAAGGDGIGIMGTEARASERASRVVFAT